MVEDSITSLASKAEYLEDQSKRREAEKEQKLRAKQEKAQAKAAAYRRQLLSKLVAPILLFVTVFIGWVLWLLAR